MARPRSEEKRLALLNAAAETVALHGIGAPTAQIAKKAGVAEGTLFRYFPTKDDLMNALYLHINEGISAAIVQEDQAGAPFQARIRHLWNSYIDWGLANRSSSNALLQLAVSAVITQETRTRVDAFFPAMVGVQSAVNNEVFAGQPAAFVDAIFVSLADTTMDFAARDPARADGYKASGFAAIWKLYGAD